MFCQVSFLLCLNNGAPVEGCIPALQVRAWLAEWLSAGCLWNPPVKHVYAGELF